MTRRTGTILLSLGWFALALAVILIPVFLFMVRY